MAYHSFKIFGRRYSVSERCTEFSSAFYLKRFIGLYLSYSSSKRRLAVYDSRKGHLRLTEVMCCHIPERTCSASKSHLSNINLFYAYVVLISQFITILESLRCTTSIKIIEVINLNSKRAISVLSSAF